MIYYSNKYPGPILVLLLFLLASCSVLVDRGPFPIEDDLHLLAGKASYLDSVSQKRHKAQAPNIILILADDLGKHDIQLYDPKGIHTPHLEKLAANGVLFQQAYSTSSVCSPSRVSLLTGRYQHRFGFERQPMSRYPNNRLEYWAVDHLVNTGDMELLPVMTPVSQEEMDQQGIPESEILISELLSAAGYATGIFGKWHLGYAEAFIPNNRGFDRQYGFYEAFTRYVPANQRDLAEHRHDYFASKHIWKQKRKGSCAIRSDHQVMEDDDYLTFSIARQACDFMDENSDRPFFLYVPFSAPHTPFQVPYSYYDRFPDETDHNKRVYKGMIAALDDAVGMITTRLEELGLAENTLILFASDNGGATYTEATDNGPLKGGKFTQFEGGINIPMIASWPGIFDSLSSYAGPVSLMDLFTTCTEAAGLPLPEDRMVDGLDLVKLMEKNAASGNSVIRDGTSLDTSGKARPLFWRTEHNLAMNYWPWKLIWNERDDQVFLYNLAQSPGEQENLAGEYPQHVEDMKVLIRNWELGTKPAAWPGVMEFHFHSEQDSTRWAI